MESKADIGLVGLAVMGQNLVLNMNDKGFVVSVYNRTVEKVKDFLKGPAAGTSIIGTYSLNDFVQSLKKPRRIMLMVKAGDVVDQFIDQITPYLEKGDIIIDGGNSNYQDTEKRILRLKEKGLHYVGAGISGGEEGARHGPSIMPGGSPEAWDSISPIFTAISAKVEEKPCCHWVGNGGAGHFVKMVHNGIEYGDMQLICEAYHLLKSVLGLKTDELEQVFQDWNERELNSYLIEISRDIFGFKDEDGAPLVDKILDVAGQKGTGKWTGINALELGVPLTLIAESVFARFLSSMKEERIVASKSLKGPQIKFEGDKSAFIEHIFQALYASKIMSYAQGFMLIKTASDQFSWDLNYGQTAFLWRGGCIIRSAFLSKITDAFEKDSKLSNLLLDSFFKEAIEKAQSSWRTTISQAVLHGIPVPCFSAALAFYDGLRLERLPQNLLQAQRDFFGAHTYERQDKPRGEFFHTNWTGRGGAISATQYNV
ncbi:MAG: 6-phosphogluconate dehydrogenase, decarboxylating [Chlamydiae bacterium]|nr:6-phosphogluconate dehydrogenase, decarboxylating [Chlamydiota bacterium]